MTDRLSALLWLWLGAAVLFVVVVAPAAFAVLPTRALAGLVVGRVLPALFWSGAVTGVVFAVTRSGWRRGAALILIVATLSAQLGVTPRIQKLRVEVGSDIEAVDRADPRRVQFGRLHALSVALLGVGMFGAAALAIASLRSTRAEEASGRLSHIENHDLSSGG